MRKVILGIVFVCAVSALFVTKFSDWPMAKQPDTTVTEKDGQAPLTHTKATTPRVHAVDSIEKTNVLKKKLNNSREIGIIDHRTDAKSHYLDNQVTVKFKVHPNKRQMAEIERAIDGELVKNLQTICIFSSKNKTSSDLVQFFNDDSNVEYVEPTYIYLPNEQPLTRRTMIARAPNDELYPDYQWNLPMIGTEVGWTFTRGSDKVTIAVVDTGVDLDHPDLVQRLTSGRNILADNDNPNDDNGHGTHVAGIIASQTNNREGIAGITWFNKIMPVKVMNKDGSGTSFDVAQGIRWATDHGADVINLSLGNYQPSKVLEEAIQYAFDKNVVIIAATGNDNTDQPGYPAAYPQVLGVSAVDQNGNRAEFSNYGTYVDVVAPGVAIASTYLGKQYAELSGTSMASPHVTALAGLIRSTYPDLSNSEVIRIIKRTTTDLGEPGTDAYYGDGLIDIVQALETTYKKRYPLGKISEWLERIGTNRNESLYD